VKACIRCGVMSVSGGKGRKPGATTGTSATRPRSIHSIRTSLLGTRCTMRSASSSSSRSQGPVTVSNCRCSRVCGHCAKKRLSISNTGGSGHRSPSTTRSSALFAHRQLRGVGLQLVGLVQQEAHLAVEGVPRLGELNPIARAIQQVQAQLALQLGDCCEHRRVRAVQPLGGGLEAAVEHKRR